MKGVKPGKDTPDCRINLPGAAHDCVMRWLETDGGIGDGGAFSWLADPSCLRVVDTGAGTLITVSNLAQFDLPGGLGRSLAAFLARVRFTYPAALIEITSTVNDAIAPARPARQWPEGYGRSLAELVDAAGRGDDDARREIKELARSLGESHPVLPADGTPLAPPVRVIDAGRDALAATQLRAAFERLPAQLAKAMREAETSAGPTVTSGGARGEADALADTGGAGTAERIRRGGPVPSTNDQKLAAWREWFAFHEANRDTVTFAAWCRKTHHPESTLRSWRAQLKADGKWPPAWPP